MGEHNDELPPTCTTHNTHDIKYPTLNDNALLELGLPGGLHLGIEFEIVLAVVRAREGRQVSRHIHLGLCLLGLFVDQSWCISWGVLGWVGLLIKNGTC